MKINVIALSVTIGLIWSVAIFIVTSANLIWSGYGVTFLEVVSSVYPGFEYGVGVVSSVTGALYGFLDGAIGGALIALVYNFFSSKLPASASE